MPGATGQMVSSDTLVDQRPFYFTHIAVDPHNADHVYAVSEMLAESKDGGHKFTEIAKDVHVDYHAIWIDPTNSKRIITGEDGGYALTNDLKNWSFSRNLAIGQVYHVGLSDENPYQACAAFQDNGGFCGPENSLDSEGILDRHWIDVVGGDGMWTVPEPGDPRYVWTDLEDGALTIFDRKTRNEPLHPPLRRLPRQLSRTVRSQQNAVSLQLGRTDRVRAVVARHGDVVVRRQRRLRVERSRRNVDDYKPRSDAQHQGTPTAVGRSAGQRRFGRGILRHDSLHRRFVDR